MSLVIFTTDSCKEADAGFICSTTQKGTWVFYYYFYNVKCLSLQPIIIWYMDGRYCIDFHKKILLYRTMSPFKILRVAIDFFN